MHICKNKICKSLIVIRRSTRIETQWKNQLFALKGMSVDGRRSSIASSIYNSLYDFF